MNAYERRQNYRLHRLRVQRATSLVDSQAPKPKQSTEEQRDMSYIEMMKSIFIRDNQRTFTQSPVKFTGAEDLIFFKNCLQTHLKSIKPNQNDKLSAAAGKKGNPLASIPAHVLRRYDQLNFVKDHQLMQQLLRPCIYLDFEVNSLQPLGRLVIQLFTEACPEVVLQFVRCCLLRTNRSFNICRLLCPLWLEAELLLSNVNDLTSSCIEHDPTAINHGVSAGILSFPSRYLRGSKFHSITFTISFTPIDVLNGKRIAFGKVKHGHNVLEHLQGLKVTRCGKPAQDVTVSSCGVMYC